MDQQSTLFYLMYYYAANITIQVIAISSCTTFICDNDAYGTVYFT